MDTIIVNDLINKVRVYQKQQDIDKILKAVEFSKNAHSKQKHCIWIKGCTFKEKKIAIKYRDKRFTVWSDKLPYINK